jgi:hypothetical protein
VETAVWILAGIFALNALIVGAVAIYEVVDRVRADREIAALERLWRSPTAFATASAVRAGFGRRLAGATLAAAVVVSGVLQANDGTRRVFTSALGVVMPVFSDDPPHHEGPALEERDGRTTPRGLADRTHLAQDLPSPAGRPSHSPSSIATSIDPMVPATVAAVPASSTRIAVDWDDVVGALGYRVQRSGDGESGWRPVATTEPEVTSYVDTGLAAATTYFYRVSAQLDEGASPPSDVVSATTTPGPPVATTVTADATDPTSIDLTWVDVDDDAGYRIERSTDGTTDWVAIATTGQDVTAATDAGLVPGTTYFYRVFATNADGDSPPSEVVTATTAPDDVGGTEGGPADGDGTVDGGAQTIGGATDAVADSGLDTPSPPPTGP